MGRNVFSPVDRSSIPIEAVPHDNEGVNVPPTVLENLTPGSFLNQDIRIKSIQLNWNTATVDVTIVGVKGEVYTLKISGGNGSDGLGNGDIMFEEQLFIQYSEVYTPLRLTLEEGMEYVFTLFDYHNTPQSTFTVIAPVSFAHAALTPSRESDNFSVVPSESPVYLDKTSDSLSIFSIVLILMIVIAILIMLLRSRVHRVL